MSMQHDWKEEGGPCWPDCSLCVAENLVSEVARLNTLLIHISHLSTLVQHDIEKANNVLLAIHETAAGKITTVNSIPKGTQNRK